MRPCKRKALVLPLHLLLPALPCFAVFRGVLFQAQYIHIIAYRMPFQDLVSLSHLQLMLAATPLAKQTLNTWPPEGTRHTSWFARHLLGRILAHRSDGELAGLTLLGPNCALSNERR